MKLLKWTIATIIVLLLIVFGVAYKKDIPVEELKAKYTDEQSKWITVDDLNVHYKDEGQGPVLVLIHGTASSLHTWDGWVKQLKNDFRVIRMDMPAFGLTGPNKTGDYRIATYVQFLNDLLVKLQVDSFSLAGNSLGGKIAWNYTLVYPEKVQKLILIDAAGFKKKPPTIIRLAQNPVLGKLLKNITPRFLIEKNLKEVYGDDSKITDALIDRYQAMALRVGNRQAFIDRANTTNPDNTDKLKNITAPTLILWGEKDIWIPLEHAQKFKEMIPNAKLIVYPGAGHIPMEEVPVETARDARDFLKVM